MIAFLQRLEEKSDLLRGAGGIEPDQADGCPRAEDRNHDRLFIDRIHENVAAVALMIEGVEFHFADASCQLASSGERSGGKRGDDGHIHHCHIPELRNDIAAAVDHNRQFGLRLF